MRPSKAIINLKSLEFNYLNIRKKVGSSMIMAVVKADSYGHGMIECVKHLNTLKKKPEYYAVAIIDEAIELKKLKIKQPILVFDPVSRFSAEELVRNEIVSTVCNKNQIKLLVNELKKQNKKHPIKVHIKINTGMNRVGVNYEEAIEFISYVSKNPLIKLDGIYTHFATSDETDKEYANLQLSRFNEIVEKLKEKKIEYGKAHCANSGAILDLPAAYFDIVRPGISLYGYYPSLETSESIKLKPVMELQSAISTIDERETGEPVSYSRRFYANEKQRIVSIPFGYADGYNRALTNNGRVIINNKIYPQVGTVTMDRIMVSIGNDDSIKAGDKVLLLGKTKDCCFDAWDWSKVIKTIPYEVTCSISKRVPREYIKK